MRESIGSTIVSAMRGALAEACVDCPYVAECEFCPESAPDEEVVSMYLMHGVLAHS